MPLRILIAPDKFKEGASAEAVAVAMARGVARALPDAVVETCPLADGGEGTARLLRLARGGGERITRVPGPRGAPVDAAWAWLPDRTAVVDMAAAAGLALLAPGERDPTCTSTAGVGALVAAALDAGARRVVVGAGGSATTDGGAGAARALGVRLDPDPGHAPTGGDLVSLHAVDATTRDPRLEHVALEVACDVANPLLGPRGAARVYAPQKGASDAQVEALERGLARWAALCGGAPGAPGAGAAGGLAYGLAALCNARLVRGIDLVLSEVGFAERLARADLVLTGEGRLDAQSAEGKVVSGIVRAAHGAGVPVVALAGALGPGHELLLDRGLTACFALADRPMSRSESLARTEALAERAAGAAVRAFAAGKITKE